MQNLFLKHFLLPALNYLLKVGNEFSILKRYIIMEIFGIDLNFYK